MRARGEEKAASVASGIDFPRTHPNLATGATAAARARTVLRAAETLAPARKRHWTAEIADIVAGGCECGYEPGDYARSDFELGPDQDKTLPTSDTRAIARSGCGSQPITALRYTERKDSRTEV